MKGFNYNMYKQSIIAQNPVARVIMVPGWGAVQQCTVDGCLNQSHVNTFLIVYSIFISESNSCILSVASLS